MQRISQYLHTHTYIVVYITCHEILQLHIVATHEWVGSEIPRNEIKI